MNNSTEKAINAIENTLKKLDINYHKPFIDLLNEYNNKLKNTQDNCLPLITSLVNKMSICILENNLEVPTEIIELRQTLSLLHTKFNLNFGIL